MDSSIKQISLFAIFSLSLCIAARAQALEEDLPNLHQVSPTFYRGGQPSEDGINQLAKLGVKTIICLRKPDKTTESEQVWAEKAGIKFVNIYLSNWFAPKDAQIDDVLEKITNAGNQPVFVHCHRGSDRTGTLVAVYRIKFENWTAKQAIVEAKSLGFGWWQIWMKGFIKDYYRDFEKGK